MADTLTTLEFQQACGGKGCPFCAISRAHTRKYVRNLLYEYATAPDIHARLAASRGLCNAHAWLMQHVAQTEEKDGLGVALFQGTVIQRLVADLRSARSAGGAHGRDLAEHLAEAIRQEEECLACEHQRDGEDFFMREFLSELEALGEQGPLVAAYRSSAGACLPHLRALFARRPSNAASAWLAARALEALRQLTEQLETYTRKHAVQYQDEPMGPERDSWIRAVEQCAGKRAVPIAAAPILTKR
jgi:hypothetical protein